MSLMADLKKNIRFKNWLNHIDGWLIVPCVTVVCVYRLCRGFSWSLVWTERSYTSLTTSVTTSETQRCVCLSVSLSVCEYVCVWSARTAHGDVTALEGNGISSRWLQDEKLPSGQPPPGHNDPLTKRRRSKCRLWLLLLSVLYRHPSVCLSVCLSVQRIAND